MLTSAAAAEHVVGPPERVGVERDAAAAAAAASRGAAGAAPRGDRRVPITPPAGEQHGPPDPLPAAALFDSWPGAASTRAAELAALQVVHRHEPRPRPLGSDAAQREAPLPTARVRFVVA